MTRTWVVLGLAVLKWLNLLNERQLDHNGPGMARFWSWKTLKSVSALYPTLILMTTLLGLYL